MYKRKFFFRIVAASTFLAAIFALYFNNKPQTENHLERNLSSRQPSMEVRTSSSGKIYDNASATAWMNASLPKGAYGFMDPGDLAAVPVPSTGHPSFDRAKFLSDCKDLRESSQHVQTEIKRLRGLGYDNAGLEMFELLREANQIRCQHVRTEDFDDIQRLIDEAVADGNPAARSQRAATLLAADGASLTTLTDELAPASLEAKAAAKETLELAATGDRVAIGNAFIVTGTDRYGIYDRMASEAWKLVLAQSADSDVFDSSAVKGQPADDLTAQEQVDVKNLARSYFERCCKAKGDEGVTLLRDKPRP